MKEIKAVIQPGRLSKIRSALRNIREFPGMTITKVEGCGKHQHQQAHGVREELIDFSNKTYIIMVVPDHLVEGILQLIVEVAHTGNVGDGLVWITPVERMVRLSEKIEVVEC